MGGKSKPTIGYWYSMLIHFGLGRGPFDSILEFRGGDKTAWIGEQTVNGVIEVDAPNLWGGEKAEGGIKGQLHVMMGAPSQMPSALLAGVLGPDQSAYRGRATVAYNGRYGAFNPYPKAAAFKVCRVLKGWDNDVCWYPARAAISAGPAQTPLTIAENFAGGLGGYTVTSGSGAAYSVAGGTLTIEGALAGHISRPITEGLLHRVKLEFFYQSPGPDDFATFDLHDTIGYVFGFNILREAAFIPPPRRPTAYAVATGVSDSSSTPLTVGELLPSTWYSFEAVWNGSTGYDTTIRLVATGAIIGTAHLAVSNRPSVRTLMFRKETAAGSGGRGLFRAIEVVVFPPLSGTYMNPAHILYDSITSAEMQGEPVSLVDDANFRAAADRLHTEGFGLCTKYDPSSETVEAFQQRICNIIGGSLSQSRIDGKYYLTLIRGDYVLASLPILQDDDILEYQEEPSDPVESVNQVTVEWFDPVKREKRSTSPLQALGAIQAAGGVIAEVAAYPEIPTESLALRVGARDLSHKSIPLKRFELTTNRIPYAWRASQFFRLQAPRRGIADMVCMVGEIDAGTPRSGTIRLLAIQDVSGMPTTTYVAAEPGVDTSPSQAPTIPAFQVAFEAPYAGLVASMTRAELSALASDAGYLLVAATRPTSGLNFDLWSRTAGAAFVDRGSGDWCPGAVVVEAAGPTGTAFTLAQATNLANIMVGHGALWGGEICRVDAINASALTVTLGRGCIDTVPQSHAAGETILFYGAEAASDAREYSAGEMVEAKVRTRTTSQLLDLALAPTLAVTMARRAARPYPPGLLRITDPGNASMAYPADAFGQLTVTWAHRDRVLQQDQLINESAASVGPEAGTTYTVRYYLNNVLANTQAGIAGTAATPYTLTGDGAVRIEVEAVRGGLVSRQPAIARFAYTVVAPNLLLTEAGDTLTTEAGDRFILE